MKIQVRGYMEEGTKEKELSGYVTDKLESFMHGEGKLESIDSNVAKITNAFGRLIDVLAKKEILNAKNIKKILETIDQIKFL